MVFKLNKSTNKKQSTGHILHFVEKSAFDHFDSNVSNFKSSKRWIQPVCLCVKSSMILSEQKKSNDSWKTENIVGRLIEIPMAKTKSINPNRNRHLNFLYRFHFSSKYRTSPFHSDWPSYALHWMLTILFAPESKSHARIKHWHGVTANLSTILHKITDNYVHWKQGLACIIALTPATIVEPSTQRLRRAGNPNQLFVIMRIKSVVIESNWFVFCERLNGENGKLLREMIDSPLVDSFRLEFCRFLFCLCVCVCVWEIHTKNSIQNSINSCQTLSASANWIFNGVLRLSNSSKNDWISVVNLESFEIESMTSIACESVKCAFVLAFDIDRAVSTKRKRKHSIFTSRKEHFFSSIEKHVMNR